jgi:protoporphyrinogen oxidase
MMWEVCRDKVQAAGGTVEMGARLATITVEGGKAVRVGYSKGGTEHTVEASHVISTMPMRELVHTIRPRPPDEVTAAADDLHYRDYLTVALVVPEARSFPDNWIYIHATDVEVGRIQNYGSWSPYLVKDGRTCLGLEYFVFEGDEMWNTPDDELIALGTRELITLGLAAEGDVERGYVVRVPKAYPYYDFSYKANVETIRKWIEAEAPNIHPVGRNGMHKYNNQDHSMYTALLTVENIFGADHDVWTVNVEEEYHESGTTGRDAPVLPRPEATGASAPATAAAGSLDPG